jgi:hypothetical protein
MDAVAGAPDRSAAAAATVPEVAEVAEVADVAEDPSRQTQ